jgi:taurine dioxygenase
VIFSAILRKRKQARTREKVLDQVIKSRGLRPLAPTVGAEVTGINLSNPSDEDIAFVLEAYNNHSALLFRGQKLSHDGMIAFSSHFGELDEAPPEQRRKAVPGRPKIYVVSNIKDEDGKAIGSLGSGEAIWHADMSNRENPPDATLLYAVEVPPEGGNTWIAGMFAALEGMPVDLRRRIEGRRIKHDGTYNSGGFVRKGVAEDTNPVTAPGTFHPAICAHPATGRAVLYLGRRRNAYVEGLSLEESEALLDDLWAHATQAKYCYVHRWQPGDLLMWDNRSTLHRRDEFDASHRRMMLRTQVKGRVIPHAA